jgi:peptidoglycan/LPS O-acetylase OafA/YrhL
MCRIGTRRLCQIIAPKPDGPYNALADTVTRQFRFPYRKRNVPASDKTHGVMPNLESPLAPPSRIPQLDALRGIAIAMVLLFHYTVHLESAGFRFPAAVDAVLKITWSGVDLFFVLSGFLIGGVLLDARASPNYFRVFYWRRAFRIFPLYFAFLAVFFLAAHFLQSTQNLFYPLIPWPICATFTQNFWMAAHNDPGAYALTPTWSLAVEEQFYLTLPALVYFVKPRRLIWILTFGMIAAPLIRLAIFLANPARTMAIAYLLPCRMDSLLFGVTAAYFMRRQRAREFLRTHRRHLWTGIELLTVLSALFLFSPNMLDPPMLLVGFDCLGLLCAAILVASLVDDRFAQFLRVTWLIWLGNISFGVYVIQQLVFGITELLLKGHTNSWAIASVLALAATIAIAKLSWEFFEKPLVGIGHRERYAPPLAPPEPL